NISVGLKNVATISEKLQPYFDFAVVESCAESPNVSVFIVHYGNRGWKLSGNKFKTLKKEQGGRKFTCVISNDQDLKGHTKNYNCDTGAEIKGKIKVKRSSSFTSTETNNVRCGEDYGECPEGQCCSKYGWCGITNEHCGIGCQKEFGECLADSTNDEY
ncbi:carbohydrate-binding module family 18 protein, partial [Piromyces sp. E2]